MMTIDHTNTSLFTPTHNGPHNWSVAPMCLVVNQTNGGCRGRVFLAAEARRDSARGAGHDPPLVDRRTRGGVRNSLAANRGVGF